MSIGSKQRQQERKLNDRAQREQLKVVRSASRETIDAELTAWVKLRVTGYRLRSRSK